MVIDMRTFFRLCLVVATSLLLFACGKEEPPVISSAEPKQPLASSVPSETSTGGNDVKIVLYPESPTSDDDLSVAVTGWSKGITYRWERNSEILEGVLSERLPAHSFAKGDTITVRVDIGPSVLQASTIIGNLPPEIISVAFADPEIGSGKDIVLLPEGVDSDGDEVTSRCVWTINGEDLLFETGTVLPAESFKKGDRISVQVIPNDGTVDGKIFHGGEFIVPNSPPLFTSEPERNFLGHEYVYQVQASDPDADVLRFSLESAPSGMKVDASTGEVRWSVGQSDAGEHLVRIVAEDSEGMRAVQEYTLSLSITQ